MDNQASEKVPILRGVSQEDPVSLKLFIATIQEVFENAQLEERGINIDGEKLSDLRFAHGVAQATEGVKEMEHQLNAIDEEIA